MADRIVTTVRTMDATWRVHVPDVRRIKNGFVALLALAAVGMTSLYAPAHAREVKYLRANTCCWDIATLEINGTIYPRTLHRWSNSLVTNNPSYGTKAAKIVNLGRDWSTFKAVIGWADRESSSRAQGMFEVILDDRIVLSQFVRFGESYPVTVDVRGALRMKLRISGVEDDTRTWFGDPAFGSARLIRP